MFTQAKVTEIQNEVNAILQKHNAMIVPTLILDPMAPIEHKMRINFNIIPAGPEVPEAKEVLKETLGQDVEVIGVEEKK